MTPDSHSSAAKLTRLFPLLIAAAGTIVYANSFSGKFVFDDTLAIVSNPDIRVLWPPWNSFRYSRQSALSGRPVVSFSVALNYALSGLDVWSYHAWNLAVHLAAGLVLYGLARRTLLCPPLGERYAPAAPWLAAAVSLVWVVHPLQTESVTYISTRTESMMGLFFLLTLYCLIRSDAARASRLWPVLSVVCCALGMGCKEVMATAPVVALLYDRAFLSPSFAAALRRRGLLYVALSATWIILAVLAAGGPRSGSVGFEFPEMTAADYVRTQFGIILRYIRLAFWPHPLVVDYHDWPTVRSWLAAAPSGIVLAVLVVVTVWAWRRFPPAGFLGAWFFLILLPSSSIVPLVTEVGAERRMYLPLVSLVVVAVLFAHSGLAEASWISTKARVRSALGAALAVATACVLGGLTIQRNRSYASELALWQDAVAKRPDNARACNNLGKALVDAGRLEEAVAHYARAVHLDPDYAEAFSNLGAALCDVGRPDEALPHHLRALELTPEDFVAHCNYAVTLSDLGKLSEAAEHYEKALSLRPDDPRIHTNLGSVLDSQGRMDEAVVHFKEALRLDAANWQATANWGNVLLKQGRAEEAVRRYREALRINPNDPVVRTNLATVLTAQGQYAEAAEHLAHAARLRPDDADAHYKLGYVRAAQGQAAEAINEYRRSLALNPASPLAATNLAWLLATEEDAQLRNPAEAVRWAEEACRLTGYADVGPLDGLAAAYAAAGRFEEARDLAGKAVELARGAGRLELAAEIQRRLDLYQQGLPFRTR